MRNRLPNIAAAALAEQYREPTPIEDSSECGKVQPAMIAAGLLENVAGRAILRVRTIRTLDRRGWAEVEFALDNGHHIRLIANGKGENLSFIFWINTAAWWKPWTWFSGYWKGIRPSDFGGEP